ncbi:MAG: DNA repair protein RadA [Bacteroidia bacterium]|nr:DNA repair protein RadA [Bacteroidia bacterium]
MSKTRTAYICQNCGASAPKWIGKCPSCNEWNTYVEEIITKEPSNPSVSTRVSNSSPKRFSEISSQAETRIDLHSDELNRVLGGGLIPGSMVLIGGEPGIGKSTLVLQIALKNPDITTLYISGEESLSQIRLRAERMGINGDQCLLLNETSLENTMYHISSTNPGLVIVDSIQTMYTDRIESSPGSVGQVRECTAELLRYAKQSSVPVILIGHINKEGNLAGPKVLEHIVDTVLQFEGDQNYMYRILRAVKNRFGSTSEIGIFEMQSKGLREVTNPSELLLAHHDENLSGTAVAATIEGIRPFLVEVQALVSSAVYGTPQRSSTGFDLRRLSMLLAVLEKRAGFRLGSKDVFLNIAGGLKINDPAVDLSVICSILSSEQDIAVDKNVCFSGEVGLTGEIRPVSRIEQRIAEAEKLGFKEIVISKYNKKGLDFSRFKIGISYAGKVADLVKLLF